MSTVAQISGWQLGWIIGCCEPKHTIWVERCLWWFYPKITAGWECGDVPWKEQQRLASNQICCIFRNATYNITSLNEIQMDERSGCLWELCRRRKQDAVFKAFVKVYLKSVTSLASGCKNVRRVHHFCYFLLLCTVWSLDRQRSPRHPIHPSRRNFTSYSTKINLLKSRCFSPQLSFCFCPTFSSIFMLLETVKSQS